MTATIRAAAISAGGLAMGAALALGVIRGLAVGLWTDQPDHDDEVTR